MKRRLPSPAELWMRDHPGDVPCPSVPAAATAWRKARGISDSSAIRWLADRNGSGTDVQIQKQIADIKQRRRR